MLTAVIIIVEQWIRDKRVDITVDFNNHSSNNQLINIRYRRVFILLRIEFVSILTATDFFFFLIKTF